MSRSGFWKLGFILVIALFFRLYRLPDVPVGFHGDEASIGYNAYSLLKTGRDQNGKLLPLAIDQFGDFRPAGYHYLAVPFIAIFGLTETATRLPAALLGAFTVLPLYFFVWQLFGKKSLALLSSFFLAISPWHITISRATSESVVALFLVLSGAYVLLRYEGNAVTRRFLVYSFLLFAASFFFYHSARLFVPIFVISYAAVLYVLKRSELTKPMWLFAAAILIVSVFVFYMSNGFGRLGQVSIFGAPGEQLGLRQQITEDQAMTPLTVRFLHNKVTYYVWMSVGNYLEHFTGKFLFLEGGQPVRYRVPWTGVMYLVDIVVLVAGIAFLIAFITTAKRPEAGLVVFAWLLLAPLPAAITFGELPSVQRAVFMIASLVILSAYGVLGLFRLFSEFSKYILIGIFVLLYGYLMTVFWHNYFFHSFTHEPWYRNAAEKELVYTVDAFVKEGKRVVMTSQNDNNLIFYLFYLKFDPKIFQQMSSPKDKDNLVFGNVTFMYKHCPLEGSEKDKALGEPGAIYVNRGGCKMPYNSEVLKDISWPDGSIAFQILQLK